VRKQSCAYRSMSATEYLIAEPKRANGIPPPRILFVWSHFWLIPIRRAVSASVSQQRALGRSIKRLCFSVLIP
jgi:hypothetical protein